MFSQRTLSRSILVEEIRSSGKRKYTREYYDEREIGFVEVLFLAIMGESIK